MWQKFKFLGFYVVKKGVKEDKMGNEIQSGYPQLPKDYWTKQNTENKNPLTDVNTNFALKDLKDISVFNAQK